MPEHPCAGGLSAACFKAYPVWARQALAYKLLHILLPKQLSKRLPRGLNLPMIGPGSILPPGVELPPGSIVAPGVTIPPGWTPGDPPPPGVQLPPSISPALISSGAAPPIFTQPWEPGPVNSPSIRGGLKTYTVSIKATETAWANTMDADWSTARNTPSGLTQDCVISGNTTAILVSNFLGIYNIQRIYNNFSLATIPSAATIISATLSLKLESFSEISARAYANIGLFVCTSPYYLETYGPPSDPVFLSLGENLFTLSADAILIIQENIGSTCCINTRENAHDYDDVPPGDTEIYEAIFYNRLAATANKPALNITYRA